MRLLSTKIVMAGLLLATVPAFALSHKHTTHKSVRPVSRARSLGSISTERATEIQTALIKQGYLSGEPSGVWDSQSVAAMSKLQGDNGWQTKVTPDARALIKLGLGPEQPPADQIVATNTGAK